MPFGCALAIEDSSSAVPNIVRPMSTRRRDCINRKSSALFRAASRRKIRQRLALQRTDDSLSIREAHNHSRCCRHRRRFMTELIKMKFAPKGMGLNDFVALEEGFFRDEGLDVEIA